MGVDAFDFAARVKPFAMIGHEHIFPGALRRSAFAPPF